MNRSYHYEAKFKLKGVNFAIPASITFETVGEFANFCERFSIGVDEIERVDFIYSCSEDYTKEALELLEYEASEKIAPYTPFIS